MYNFGKLTGRKKVFNVGGRDIPVLAFYDKDDIEWHDLFKKHPCDYYIIVSDDGEVISFQEDPEHSQIGGYDIYGLTNKEVKKKKEHSHFDGKKFYTPDLQPTYEDILQAQIDVLKAQVKELMENLDGNKNTGRRDGTDDCSGCSNCPRP